jgi:hypothetical protein
MTPVMSIQVTGVISIPDRRDWLADQCIPILNVDFKENAPAINYANHPGPERKT